MESLKDMLKWNIGDFNYQKWMEVNSLYNDLTKILDYETDNKVFVIMEQYISKPAVIAEIKRRMKYNGTRAELDRSAFMAGREKEDEDILAFLNTLEEKEVDLELNSFDATVCKIGNSYLKEMDKNAIVKALEPYKDGDKVKVIIIAQKGE